MEPRGTSLLSRPLAGAVAMAGLALCWLLPVSVSWNLAPDLGHSWAVPLLMGYLYWERWADRPAGLGRRSMGAGWWFVAVLLVALQLPLRLLLTPYPLLPTMLASYTGLFVGVAAGAAWLWGGGAALRWLGGPLILLVSALPAPTAIERALIIPLREVMAAFAAEISNLLGHPALAAGTSVQLASGWVGVDEACGGIRSLQACVMIGLFFGEWYRFGWMRRLALVALGVSAALVGNFARVIYLSLQAGTGGGGAVQATHDAAGWAAMLGSLLLTGWLACHWAGYRWPRQSPLVSRVERPSVGWVWLLAVVLGFAVTEAGTRLWYRLGEVERMALAQWTVRLPENHWSYQRAPLAENAREMLRPDAYTAGWWRMGEEATASAYYIEWRHGQVARSVPFLHNPTVCLPYAGCELVATLPPLVVHWSGGEIPFHAYKFRRANEDLLVAFVIWDPLQAAPLQRAEQADSWLGVMSLRWNDVKAARQHQPAQLLTVSIPWRKEAIPTLEKLIAGMVFPAVSR